MRFSSYLIMASAFLAIGCSGATTKIGTTCHSDGDCNVAGQKCVAGLIAGQPTGPKICTHPCTGEFGDNGCPIGYDCTVSDQAIGTTCNVVPYAVDPTTGAPVLFGKSCVTATDCMGTGDNNAMPMCRYAEDPGMLGSPIKTDSNAYCTGSCAADSDCPLLFQCIADYDKVMKCVKRSLCDACTINDDCPQDFPFCVPTSDGSNAHYCTKECGTPGDCPGAAQSVNYMRCIPGTDVSNRPGDYCFHAYGACVGHGQVCDPCRSQTDCKQSGSPAGLVCITNMTSLERMCSKGCNSDADCTGPNTSSCDNTDLPSSLNPSGMSLGICTGDSTAHQNPGLFTCHI